MSDDQAAAILTLERQALDRWSQGDPAGYIAKYADDVTYFDDVGAQRRVDGLSAVRDYFRRTFELSLPAHTYELIDPKVQVFGDIGIVTLRYHPSKDGKPLTPWKATEVYRRAGNEWRVVHAHWSTVKEA
jgi:ketosteroid isomerase-like protein